MTNDRCFETQPIYVRPRILLCDQDQAFLDWLESIGKNLMVDLTVVHDKSGVLLELSKRKFDAVIFGVSVKSEKQVISCAQEIRRLSINASLPIGFIAESANSLPVIEKADVASVVVLVKPVNQDALANCIDSLLSYKQFSVLVISEQPQATAKVAMYLNRNNFRTRYTLHPGRYREFLYDFDPELVIVDSEIFSMSSSKLSREISGNPRWNRAEVVVFSSKSRDIADASEYQAKLIFELSELSNGKVMNELRDLSKDVRASREEERIESDQLTGLFLRDKLYERFIPQIQDKNNLTNLCFAWIDIFNLQGINEKFGHSVGDRVLKTVATFLKQRFEMSSAFLCRWEEDEIVVVVKDSADAFLPLLSHALLDFALLDIPIVERSIRLNAGLASYPDDGDSIDEILDMARWRVHNARGSDQGICAQ